MRSNSKNLNTSSESVKRDNQWLLVRLEAIWQKYFSDIPQKNEVYIGFSRSSLYRFGSIRLRLSDNSTHIKINGLFKKPNIPSEMVDHTIAHELVHYSHGFSSLHPRMHRYPHRGGIIDKELKSRNLGHLVDFYNSWVQEYVKELDRRQR